MPTTTDKPKKKTWIFKVYPAWKLEEKEQWLAHMLANGYKLDYVIMSVFHRFVSAPKEDATFFHVYSVVAGPSMDEERNLLTKLANFKSAGAALTVYTIFCVRQMNQPLLLNLYQSRARFLRKHFLRNFLLFLFGSLGLLYFQITDGISFYITLAVLMFFMGLYAAVEYIMQRKVCRKYENRS